MATVTATEYTGLIFCPTVSTGAFVARRNGKVFITGNSGFPKSHDVSKAIDKAAGAEREVVGSYRVGGTAAKGKHKGRVAADADEGTAAGCFRDLDITTPATPDALRWQGWGTALKPAWEPIIVARKPLIGTVAANVLEYGTGALNIDGCRVGTEDNLNGGFYRDTPDEYQAVCYGKHKRGGTYQQPLGRWPANLIHDGSDEVTALFPQTQTWAARGDARNRGNGDGSMFGLGGVNQRDEDSGSAARFFYCAKASKSDRDEGLDGMPEQAGTFGQKRCAKCGRQAVNVSGTCQCDEPEWVSGDAVAKVRNHHPTVKPTALIRYLVRLVTPPGGVVLDPFMGSGSTGKAAALEGFDFVGIELDAEYLEIARRRIEHAQMQPPLDGLA